MKYKIKSLLKALVLFQKGLMLEIRKIIIMEQSLKFSTRLLSKIRTCHLANQYLQQVSANLKETMMCQIKVIRLLNRLENRLLTQKEIYRN